MTCQEFEALINDLAREQMVPVADRARALVHAETCSRCAGRLRRELTVSAGLRVLASSTEELEAQPQVEGALRYAFRQQSRRPGPVVTLRWQGWGGAVAMGAVAAGMLLVLALTAGAFRKAAPPERRPAEGSRQVKPSRQNRIENATAAPAGDPDSTGEESGRTLAAMTPVSEDMAAFVALQAGEDLADVEGGQVMRLQVSTAELVALGWSLDTEDAADRVEADVLLGQDGVAHGIRLVH